MFFKTGVIINFPIFIKNICAGVSFKVTGLMACNLIKNETQHGCFPVNITKCLRKAFFYGAPLVAASEND